jgi:excisionase family DNA binding protein
MTVKGQDATVERLVTIPELSEMSGVPISTLHDLTNRGELPLFRMGTRKRVRLEDWAEYLADNYESRHDI